MFPPAVLGVIGPHRFLCIEKRKYWRLGKHLPCLYPRKHEPQTSFSIAICGIPMTSSRGIIAFS